MAMEAAMALTNRLLSHAQALGAITAYMRASEGADLDPDLRAAIDRIIDVLDAREAIAALSEHERSLVVAFARSYLHQALELADEPTRANAWSHSDPAILQAQGAASGVVARLIQESGLGAPGSRILDIGTGVAGLAIAFCKTFPNATVVGLDPWAPALELARANVKRAGLQDRITLLGTPVQSFDDDAGFDLIWVPSFFLPPAVLDSALPALREMLRPGGSVVVGVTEGTDDPLAGAVDTMITIRSGGSALEPADAMALLRKAGFADVSEVSRTWQAPLRLVAARSDGPSQRGRQAVAASS